jgi:hypothetical protein
MPVTEDAHFQFADYIVGDVYSDGRNNLPVNVPVNELNLF